MALVNVSQSGIEHRLQEALLFHHRDPHEVLGTLKALFVQLKLSFSRGELRESAQPVVELPSHSKWLIVFKETPLGLLKFERVRFHGGSYTGPHIHPEFWVEEIQWGFLMERLFLEKGSGWQMHGLNRRAKGALHASYDLKGRPHDVLGSCESLCLSLGQNQVTPIPISEDERRTDG